MEHPPKQGLKRCIATNGSGIVSSFNGTSTKTRIETRPRKSETIRQIPF